MIKRRARGASAAVVVGLGLLFANGGALADAPAAADLAAATASTGQSREQVNPARQIEPTRRQRPADMFSEPGREACQLSDDPALAFDFHRGVVEDEAKVLSDGDKQAAWGDALGHRITPRALCEIRDRLARRIFRRGVLARVIIPPQTISGGVVSFRVIAAKIVSVRFDGDDIGPAQAKVEAYLNHLRHRAAFDLDTVQRWLLLANDIPGVQATAKIIHSTAPGAPPEGLDLVVTVRRVAIDQFGEIANSNAKTLGPWNGIVRLDLNSFTPFGERTSLIAYTTLGNNRQEVIQVIEAAKIGDSGLFTQASFSWGHSRPGNVLAPLDLTGDSYVGTVELDYPLLRLQRATVLVAGGMDFVNQTTTFPTGQALSNDALRVLWARTDASVIAADRPVMDNLVTSEADLSLQVRKGLEILGASEAGAPDLSRVDGRADAWVARAEGHASLRVAPNDVKFLPITFSLHFIGQWADRPLLSYEQQAIGNLSIGRGYDPNVVSGDRVAAGEFKVELGPAKLWRRATITPYVFDDVARVGYLALGQPDVTLRSLGSGLEFRIPYDSRGDAVRIDTGYAKPLDKPIPSAAKKPPDEFLVQFVVSH